MYLFPFKDLAYCIIIVKGRCLDSNDSASNEQHMCCNFNVSYFACVCVCVHPSIYTSVNALERAVEWGRIGCGSPC